MTTRFGLVIVVLLAMAGAIVPTTRAAQQPVTVGQTSVGWTGNWQYDPASSMDQQATLTQVDAASGSIKLATYGEFVDGTVIDANAALETFSSSFFEGAGATAIVEQDAGTLPNGAVWRISTFDLQGLDLTFLITASEIFDGTFVVSTLTGNTDQFSATIAQAQQEISLNGMLTYLDGVDAAAVTGWNTAAASHPVSNDPDAVESRETPPPSSVNRPASASGGLEILSVSQKDAGIGDGSIYVYVEVANNTGELYSYVGVEGTCRSATGGILGTGIGNTMNVAPGETVVITMIIMSVPGCDDVDVRFDGLTGKV